MPVSLRDTISAAASFGVTGAPLLGGGALPPGPAGLSFAVWRTGRRLFAAAGSRLSRGRLRLRRSALFGWLAGRLPRGGCGGLRGRFGGPTDSSGPAVVRAVGYGRQAYGEDSTRAERDGCGPATERPGG